MQCKFIKITLNSTQNRQKTQKAQKDKTSFPKKLLEIADQLNKIMTTHK